MRDFIGASGENYVFYSYDLGFILPPVSGIYIITKGKVGKPIYIGQTSNLENRFRENYHRSCIIEQDCDTIWVCKSANLTNRFQIEKDLCDHYNPICNKSIAS